MMGRSLSQLSCWYDNRPKRERIVLLICAVVVLVFLLNLLVFEPYSQQRKRAQSEATQVQVDISELTVRSAEVEARRANDPDKINREKLSSLKQQREKLNEELQTNIVTLVPPKEMAGLLKSLLTQEKKLQLIHLENLTPEILSMGQSEQGEALQPKIYRHSLQMEFSGDYLTLLKYLKRLGELPRALIWEEIDVETLVYPQTRVRLQVSTLSLTEGWIGG